MTTRHAGNQSTRTFEAVVMDIDGTLTTSDTLALTSEKLGLPGPELASISRGYQDGELSDEQVHELVLRRWQASGKANRPDMERIFRSLPLRDDALDLISRIHAMSLSSCLITSSMDFYAEVMADRLSVANFYANLRLHFNDGDGSLNGMEFTKEAAFLKREQLENFCSKKGISPDQVMVIGNADNDQEMFEITGNGVLLSDDGNGELASTAWRVVSSLTEAADLLHSPRARWFRWRR
jgi:HAD superfamily phosphoserine phosphatase-like hydrolase